MSVLIDGSAGITTNTGAVYNGLQSTTAVASTSGTAVLFTGIPLWTKRITAMFNAVSTNGTSLIQVQLGSGSVTTSGYICLSQGIINAANAGVASYTSGCVFALGGSATTSLYGNFVCTLITGNTWTFTFNGNDITGLRSMMTTGSIALSGSLDRVNITTVAGTDTFDAGTINLIYE